MRKVKLTTPQRIIMFDMMDGAQIKHYKNSKGKLCFDTDWDGHATLCLTLSMRALHNKGLIILNDDGLCELTKAKVMRHGVGNVYHVTGEDGE